MLWTSFSFALSFSFFFNVACLLSVLVHSVFKRACKYCTLLQNLLTRYPSLCLQHCKSSILLSNFVCVTTGCSSSLCVFIKVGSSRNSFFNLASDGLSVCNFNFPRTRSHEQLHFFYAYLFIMWPYHGFLSGLQYMTITLDIFIQCFPKVPPSLLNNIPQCQSVDLSLRWKILFTTHCNLRMMLQFTTLCVSDNPFKFPVDTFFFLLTARILIYCMQRVRVVVRCFHTSTCNCCKAFFVHV